MSPQPLVAVTMWRRALPTYLGPHTDLLTLGGEYVDAIRDSGLIPLLVTQASTSEAAEVLSIVDGLILTGGEDVDAAAYDGLATSTATDPRRDATETALVTLARQRHLPTLGICRGMQITNVAFGGTLLQDLPESVHHPAGGADRLDHRHPIDVTADWLAETFDSDEAIVNSLHHQGIDQLSVALRAVAWSRDGVIEAVESTDGTWPFLGVQWHPEKMHGTNEGSHRARLFAHFAALVHQRRTTVRAEPEHRAMSLPAEATG